MDANGRELIFKDEVYSIVSCAFEVLNGIGQETQTGVGTHRPLLTTTLFISVNSRPFAVQIL